VLLRKLDGILLDQLGNEIDVAAIRYLVTTTVVDVQRGVGLDLGRHAAGLDVAAWSTDSKITSDHERL